MKLTKLSEKCLSAMYKEYADNDRINFEFDFFKKLFNESNDKLNMAIITLSKNNLVSVLWADDVAYNTTLLNEGIVYIESNPKLSKAMQTLKSIKDLLTW